MYVICFFDIDLCRNANSIYSREGHIIAVQSLLFLLLSKINCICADRCQEVFAWPRTLGKGLSSPMGLGGLWNFGWYSFFRKNPFERHPLYWSKGLAHQCGLMEKTHQERLAWFSAWIYVRPSKSMTNIQYLANVPYFQFSDSVSSWEYLDSIFYLLCGMAIAFRNKTLLHHLERIDGANSHVLVYHSHPLPNRHRTWEWRASHLRTHYGYI